MRTQKTYIWVNLKTTKTDMNTLPIVSVILAVLVAILILFIAVKTDILKAGGAHTPYSFSKFQLLLWTLVICPLFAVHWGFHYADTDFRIINDTSLILLGIALGTTITSTVIDHTQLAAQRRNPAANLAVLKVTNTSTSNFWADILSGDDNNPSIQRLQNLVFTLIFIVIYVATFFKKEMQYPEFDQTAYILMGISSGGYLIGKGMNR